MDLCAGRLVDADRHLVALSLHIGHHAMDPTDCDHAVLFFEIFKHRAKFFVFALLGPQDDEIKETEHDRDQHRYRQFKWARRRILGE